MKLTFYPYNLILRNSFTVATYSRTFTPGVQVEIEHEGFVGYGEASMPPYLGEGTQSVLSFLSKIDLSKFRDPFDMEDILKYVDDIETGNTAAKASIDIALHDLIGKLLNTPWYKIWGLNKEKAPFTTYTIGIDEEKAIKEKALSVKDRFKILKIKLGSDNDKGIIKAIRAVTDLPLAVDANQGWKDKLKALDMIYWLKEQNVVMIEQPMPKDSLEEIAWITQHSPLPVFADESVQRLEDITKLKGVFTGINVKLMKCTGMREAWKMINLSKALGMEVMIGCMTETSCAISAATQLSPFVDFADLDGNLLINNDLFKGVEIVGGKIMLNDLPGIGVEKLNL